MDIKADARQGFILKFALIGLAAVAFGGWHLNDAIVYFPSLRPHADAYLEMRGPLDANGEALISDGDLQDAWKEYAEPRGLPVTQPKLHDEIHNVILYNYFIGVIFSILGAWCLINGLPAIGKWIELKDGVLADKSGKTIALSDITEIDKKRWEKKGLTKITAISSGVMQTMIIDDIKFEREPTDKIMAEIERVVGEEKIINGKPETEYEKLRLEKEAKRKMREEEMNQMDEQD